MTKEKQCELFFELGFNSFIKEAIGFNQYSGSNGMPFPNRYMSALKSGSKNQTYRVSNEIGKYKVGTVYRAVSNGNRDLGIDIKVISVDRVQISDIPSEHACEIATYHPSAKEADRIKFEIV